MFNGGTSLCKVKAILLPVKLKASPGRQGAKGIPKNLKKGQIHHKFGGQEVLLHGFVSFLRKVKGIFFWIQLLKGGGELIEHSFTTI